NSYGTDPAMAPLQRNVELAMRQRYERFESGMAGVEALNEGLQFARVSAAAYPEDPAQKDLRQKLDEKRKWLDQKVAILRAFASAGEWDAFLLADRDFERYRTAFKDII